MVWKLEKQLDAYVLMPFKDTTVLERVFHELHREALEEHKTKTHSTLDHIDTLLSTEPYLISRLIKDDFIKFYTKMFGFIPMGQWDSMTETIWSQIEVLFKSQVTCNLWKNPYPMRTKILRSGRKQ